MSASESPGSSLFSGRRAVPLAGAFLVLAGLAAYHGSFHGPFVYDDNGAIAGNASITRLCPIWHLLKPLPGGMPVSGRPVTNLSFALNYAVSGLDVWSYHAANLAIHLLAGLTLFGVLRRTLAAGKGGRSLPLALVIALIWTLHPLQTESVVYLSQRAESLMGLFYLLTLYCFIRGAGSAFVPHAAADGPEEKTGGPWWLGLSVLAGFLGMAAKEVMISAPLIVLLYDRTFVAGEFREAWRRRKAYYLCLAATWLVLAGCVLVSGGRGGTAGFGIRQTPLDYALTQFPAIVHYLRLSFWPHPLSFLYGDPGAGLAATAVDAVVVGTLVALTLYFLFRPATADGSVPAGRAAGFAAFAAFAVLAPSSSVVPVGIEMVAEHRMYLPLAAVIALAAAALSRWLVRLAPSRGGATALFLLFAAAVACGAATERRIRDYRSELLLWGDTAVKMPNLSTVREDFGIALLKSGQPVAAIGELRAALRLNPANDRAESALADALAQIGRREEAIAHERAALRISPGLYEARNNLGIALAQSGRWTEALEQFQAAVRLNPDLFETHDNLARILAKLGRLPEAEAEFAAALRLRPDDPGARAHLERVRELERSQPPP